MPETICNHVRHHSRVIKQSVLHLTRRYNRHPNDTSRFYRATSDDGMVKNLSICRGNTVLVINLKRNEYMFIGIVTPTKIYYHLRLRCIFLVTISWNCRIFVAYLVFYFFQTLFEKEGVYIHINVNTHTSDKDAHLPGRIYLLQKVFLTLMKPETLFA